MSDADLLPRHAAVMAYLMRQNDEEWEKLVGFINEGQPPMAHLVVAEELFRKEAAAYANDPPAQKAALEDAEEVAKIIGAIENGLNH